MKKAVIAILAILYITVTSGVAVNIHYCMGAIASVEYGYDDHDACGKCGMKESLLKKGCCHSEVKLVKVQDAHQLVKANAQQLSAPVVMLPESRMPVYSPVLSRMDLSYASHAPPDAATPAAYLLHCVFRI